MKKHDHDEEHEHLLKELIKAVHENNRLLKENMIAQATLDASLAALTSSVDNAVAALATIGTSTSTPDAAVAAYQAGVDAQTVRLATATPPVTPAPAAK
jgi:phage I-like protein